MGLIMASFQSILQCFKGNYSDGHLLPFSIALLRREAIGLIRLLPFPFHYSLRSCALSSSHLKYFSFLNWSEIFFYCWISYMMSLSCTLPSHSLFGLTLPHPAGLTWEDALSTEPSLIFPIWVRWDSPVWSHITWLLLPLCIWFLAACLIPFPACKFPEDKDCFVLFTLFVMVPTIYQPIVNVWMNEGLYLMVPNHYIIQKRPGDRFVFFLHSPLSVAWATTVTSGVFLLPVLPLSSILHWTARATF